MAIRTQDYALVGKFGIGLDGFLSASQCHHLCNKTCAIINKLTNNT